MLATTVQHIPAEVLNHVFKQLEPCDLKSVVLVCERWRDIAEAPNLWTWVFHWVNRGNLANMPYILAAKRMNAGYQDYCDTKLFRGAPTGNN